jgi:hypothetical protein
MANETQEILAEHFGAVPMTFRTTKYELETYLRNLVAYWLKCDESHGRAIVDVELAKARERHRDFDQYTSAMEWIAGGLLPFLLVGKLDDFLELIYVGAKYGRFLGLQIPTKSTEVVQ